MIDMPNDTELLKGLVRTLWGRVERLEAENAELRRRLGMDSTNSDKPPSSDGYKKKPITPGIPKEKGRRNGGQEGHKGKTLKQTENPDRVEVHLPEQCDCCGRSFEADLGYEIIQSRQVFDLPEPKLEVTEHRIGQIRCCGGVQRGEYPAGINAPVQYGPGVRALVTMLSVDNKMPLEQISRLFEDLYEYDLNSGTILDILERGYEQSAPLEAATKNRLQEEEIVHFDETGIRVRGKLHWMHTASTSDSTYLFIHEKRGYEAHISEQSVLKVFNGIAVHDCLAAYFKFDVLLHVLCGAHLLRELNALKENDSLWADKMHEFLLELYGAERPIIAEQEVRKHYQSILVEADREEPPPKKGKRGRPKQSTGRNLLNRLRKHENGVLAFALRVGVPFTNNQAERDLRPSKVKLKVSGCLRTVEGAHTYARIQAVTSTFRKRGLNVFTNLRQVFASPLAV